MNELEKAQLAVEQANQAVLEASKTIQKLVAENAALKARLDIIHALMSVKDELESTLLNE